MRDDSAPTSRATIWAAGVVAAVITLYIFCPVLFILPGIVFQRMGVLSGAQSKEYARRILTPLSPLVSSSNAYKNVVESEFRYDPTGLVNWSVHSGAPRMRRAGTASPALTRPTP